MATTLPQGPAEPEEPSDAPLRGLRGRAVVTAFALIPPVCYATSGSWPSTIISLMTQPVAALLLLLIVNWPLRKFAPKWAYSQSDLIVVFSILAVAASLAGEWGGFVHNPIHYFPHASSWSPTVKDTILPNMPDWLVLKDLTQVEDLSGGGRDWQYVWGKMPLFFPKYLAWGALVCSVCFAMMCINSLMRGAWCQRERLTFPLIQLPVAMCEKGGAGGMWRSKHMWIAFSVMFFIDILNGLNYLYPNLPSVPTKQLLDLQMVFRDPPASNMGQFPIAIYPFMAVIGFFMPSDLVFSCVAFFLLRKLTHLVLAANGIPQGTFKGTAIDPGAPYFDEQTWGGVLAMFLGVILVSKGYLREVWRDIRTGNRALDGGFAHRWAFFGLLVSSSVVMWFGVIGGLPLPYMVVYFALFLIFSIVLTRIRAQLGPPTHEFAFFGPNSFMNRFFGTKWLTDRQVTTMSTTFVVINRMSRNHPMPYVLEGMKMTMQERIAQRKVFWVLALATVVGFLVGQFTFHVHAYRTGNLGWTDAITYAQRIMADRKGPDLIGITMTIFGFAMVTALDAIRFRFPTFPLHPAGYVLSMNFGVDYYWFGLLIALIIKNFVQRYYGLKGYDKLRSVALGILVAEYAAEAIWMTMALVTHQSTYTISFNDRSLLRQ